MKKTQRVYSKLFSLGVVNVQEGMKKSWISTNI